MILLFSTSRDETTTEVMRWLNHLGAHDLIRINSDESSVVEPIHFELDECKVAFWLGPRRVSLEEIKAVWYRKGRRWLCNQFFPVNFKDRPRLENHLRERLCQEELRLSEFLHFLIERSALILGSSARSELNKLLVIHEARNVGLLTPSICVSNRKDSLAEAVAQEPTITKPVSDVVYLFDSDDTNVGYFSYTEVLTSGALSDLPERLSPSLIQQQIEKSFEARVFVLDGKCHAMAIFSQRDERTRVDFRRYNLARPNRTVPLTLGEDLQGKILTLFKRLQLNTGSVDFIVDMSGRFFFLEINPVGQFSMVSSPCNYYLEREVALLLHTYAS